MPWRAARRRTSAALPGLAAPSISPLGLLDPASPDRLREPHAHQACASRHPSDRPIPWRRALVEPVGIEPTTPCLQSRCSPS